MLEAMPPLIGCAFIAFALAVGLFLVSPGKSDTTSKTRTVDSIDSGKDSRGTGNRVEGVGSAVDPLQRVVYISREYRARLGALGERGGTAFHGIPTSDFDGDGSQDILVMKPRVTNLLDGSDPAGGYGTVEIWNSLLASAPLRIHSALKQNDLFGLSSKSAGDLDGDGADDVITGAPIDHGGSITEGAVHVHSGSDGQLLLTINGLPYEYFGWNVGGVSDVDGDGQWDIAASSWAYDADYVQYGRVNIHSGSDGVLIRTLTSSLVDDGFGYEVVGLGDLDGDTQAEVAVTAALAPGDPRAYAPSFGRLYVFNGQARQSPAADTMDTDASLVILNSDPLISHFAVAVEKTTDEDGDGLEDLIVTSLLDPYVPEAKTTAVQIYSSADGSMLWPVATPPPGGTGRDEDGQSFPQFDDDGELILYAHYMSELGVFGDASRDLAVDLADLAMVAELLGEDAQAGNPVSGDVSADGVVDLDDLNSVSTQFGASSMLLDRISDIGRLLARWNALNPFQYGDYVLAETGRSNRDSGGSVTDPVYIVPHPLYPGFAYSDGMGIAASPDKCANWLSGTPGNCVISHGCIGPGCDHDLAGGADGGTDANGNGIPDGVDCAAGANPPPTTICPNPCADDDGDGIPNQQDCDSPCFDDRYLPPGSDGSSCVLCEDDDCDGISNQNDCDSDCYQGDRELDCACQDDDADGIKNQDDQDSACFESGWLFDVDIDSDNDDGIDVPSRSVDEEAIEDELESDHKLIPINSIDADVDGIVDYADGFNLNGIDGDSDDLIDPDDADGVGFTPLVLELLTPENCSSELTINFSYSASDPALVDFDENGNPETPESGLLRIWTKDATQARSPRSISDAEEPGDYVKPGTHPIENFEFDNRGIAILYVEAVRIEDWGPSLPIQVSLDGAGDGIIALSDRVRARTFVLESVIFDEVTGEVEPAPVILDPADLQPELWLTSVSAELLSYTTMEITVEGVVRDRLSELTLNPDQQLESLHFYVEGHHKHTLSGLPDLTVTEPIAPWQLATLEVPFSVTFQYDAPTGHFGAGGVPIDVMTSINAAGQNNRVSTFVGVNWLDIDWITGESLSPLPGFVGGRTPLELNFPDRVGPEPGITAAIGLSYNGTSADAMLTVTAGGLGTYQGDFTVLGATSNVFLNAVGDRLLDPNEPDVISFDASYSTVDGEPREHRLVFIESGNDSAHFVQELQRGYELSFDGSSSTTSDTAAIRYTGDDGLWTYFTEPDGLLDSPSLVADPADFGFNGEQLRLDLGANLTLDPSEPDVLAVALVLSSGAGELAIATQWVETGADTRIFRSQSGELFDHPNRIPWAIRNTPYESSGFIPVIGYLPEFTPPDEESFPSLNRIVQRISGLGDNVNPEVLGISDSFDIAPVEAHAYSPYRYYSMSIENGRVVVHLFTAATLPPGLDEAKLRTGFDSEVHNAFATLSQQERSQHGVKHVRAYIENLRDIHAEPYPAGEEEEITLEGLFIWFEFLLNEDSLAPGGSNGAALELLGNYTDNGGVVVIEDIDQALWNHLPFTAMRKWEVDIQPEGGHPKGIIRIDPRHVDDPAEAAHLLHVALLKVHESGYFLDVLDIDGAGLNGFQSILRDRWNRVAETASAGANLYISGIALFAEGADWALTINSILEGDAGWEAAFNFLPFASAALTNKFTRQHIKICRFGVPGRLSSCEGHSFSKSASQRLANAQKKRAFADRLDILKVDLAAITSFEQRRKFAVLNLRPNKKGDRLGKGLKNWFNGKPRGYVAHHMMPREFRDDFVAWGFDVDDYRELQGVYIRRKAHTGYDSWHRNFNAKWKEKLEEIEGDGYEIGRQKIRDFLNGDAKTMLEDLKGRYQDLDCVVLLGPNDCL
ncbi:MAG: hypothetical protein ABL309_01910 [Phycisphaerales bacterium]